MQNPKYSGGFILNFSFFKNPDPVNRLSAQERKRKKGGDLSPSFHSLGRAKQAGERAGVRACEINGVAKSDLVCRSK